MVKGHFSGRDSSIQGMPPLAGAGWNSLLATSSGRSVHALLLTAGPHGVTDPSQMNAPLRTVGGHEGGGGGWVAFVRTRVRGCRPGLSLALSPAIDTHVRQEAAEPSMGQPLAIRARTSVR